MKRLRTDNGLEFVNREMQKILNQNGIKHRSVPYNPEQNGAIERENRTIVEAARSMLYAKGMSLRLWAEAVHTAVYVLNCTENSSVSGKSPHELWFGRATGKLEFHTFGTKVFTHIPKQKRTKGIFVCYSENVKGCRIFFPDENKVDVCRDVKFLPKKVTIEVEKRNGVIAVRQLEIPEDEEELEQNQRTDEQQEVIPKEKEIDETCPDNRERRELEEEDRKLRDRKRIRKPSRYKDFELEVANLLVTQDKQPTTY